MTQYVYPAIFTEEQNGAFSVEFPDLQGCYTCGDNLPDAIYMAEDVLAFTLYLLEKRGENIPEPSLSLDAPDGAFVNLIACDTLAYHKKNNKRAIKKTLTIPEWLNEYAMDAGINFSQTLQDALMEKLGVV